MRCERADARELARGLSRPLRELGPGVDEPTVSRLGRPAAAPSGFRPEGVLPETPSVRRTDRR